MINQVLTSEVLLRTVVTVVTQLLSFNNVYDLCNNNKIKFKSLVYNVHITLQDVRQQFS